MRAQELVNFLVPDVDSLARLPQALFERGVCIECPAGVLPHVAHKPVLYGAYPVRVQVAVGAVAAGGEVHDTGIPDFVLGDGLSAHTVS